MKVLVTGGAGYLGSLVVRKLAARGHAVRVLDIGYFGLDHVRLLGPQVEVIRDDVRRFSVDPAFASSTLEGCDSVIHLAAISNDPSAELNPSLTEDVNFTATQALAETAKRMGVSFLFSSSCSVYGEAEGTLDENGPVKPLTTYATSKVDAETALIRMTDASWAPVILRNGTLFGFSPRMRFDLVANIFAMCSALYNEVRIFGDGQQWRPFLHVSDCARAFVFFAERGCQAASSATLPQGERERPSPTQNIYNVSHENLRVVDLAALFQELNPRLRVTHVPTEDEDRRDYRVSTAKLHETGFRTRVAIDVGCEELVEAIWGRLIPDPESLYYRNAKWLKELTQLGSMNHREIVSLMETLANMRLPITAPIAT